MREHTKIERTITKQAPPANPTSAPSILLSRALGAAKWAQRVFFFDPYRGNRQVFAPGKSIVFFATARPKFGLTINKGTSRPFSTLFSLPVSLSSSLSLFRLLLSPTTPSLGVSLSPSPSLLSNYYVSNPIPHAHHLFITSSRYAPNSSRPLSPPQWFDSSSDSPQWPLRPLQTVSSSSPSLH